MRRFLVLLTMFLVTGFLMAQDHAAAEAAVTVYPYWSPAVGMAIAAGLCGLGQARAIAAACEGIARNPAAANNIRTTLIIGLALIESLALYTLLVAMVKG